MSFKTELRDFFSGFASAGISDFLPGMMLAPSEAGVAVTEMTSIQIAAVAGCIRVLSNSIGMLPVNVMQRVKGGQDLAADHALYSLLHDAPNEEYTAVDFWTILETHRVLTGNAYAEIVRDNGGRPAEFWIRSPFRTFPYRVQKTSKLVYKTTDTFDGNERVILAEDMLHFKNFGIDPWVGLSPIRYHAREVLGNAIALQNYGARFFNNDARPGGYISSAEVLQPQRKLELATNWQATHSRSGAHAMAILDGGLKWETVGIQPDEAQFIQSKELSKEDICAIYGVPSHFVGGVQTDKVSGLEQRFLEFLIGTLKPNLRRYEAEINAKLFANNIGRSANKYFAKFDTDDYQRADFATTLKALQVGRYAGLITPDEGRHMLGLNPVDPKQLKPENPGGGLWVPVNMTAMTDEAPPPPPAPVAPGKKPEAGGTPEQAPAGRALFNVFFTQMSDAITRISARNKPDLRDFERVFTPILVGLAASVLPLEGDITMPVIVAGAIKVHCAGIYERSTTWDKDNLGEMSADELNLAMQKIIPVAQNSVPEEK
jgi:HK97 family phage portal protein